MASKNAIKHTTILMEKINMDNGIFVYRPVNAIRGDYRAEENTFYDEYGNFYYNISDALMMGYDSEEIHGFTMHYTDNDLKNHFPADTVNESIGFLLDHMKEYIWIGIPDMSETKIVTTQVAVDSFFQMINQQESAEQKITEDDVVFSVSLSEEEMNDLLKLKSLKEVKEALSKYNERYINGKQQVIEQMSFIDDDQDLETEPAKETKKNKPVKKEKKQEPIYKQINVEELYNYITERVIGQDDAVREIITSFLMNRITIDMNFADEDELTRMLLTGPTGCGKTMILDTMLEYLSKVHNLKYPIAKIPTSQLTAAGYVGMNLEDILETLLYNVKGEFYDTADKIRYAERNGIVFLDEIDKKGSNDNGDVSGRGVLNALLEFMTGADYQVGKGAYVHKFNTKYLTIIASGAFANVYDNKSSRAIGFGADLNLKKKKIAPEDFVEKGLMPSEFMGRFHKIIPLDPLSKNTLERIIIQSKKSTLLAARKRLEILEVDLAWDESYIKKVAEEAYKMKMGGRALKSIVEGSLSEITWEALKQQKPLTVNINDETVMNPSKIIVKERKINTK